MDPVPVLALAKDLRQALRNGHPWVYDRALAGRRPRVKPGTLVRIAHAGVPLAVGFADPNSAIAVRVLGLTSGAASASVPAALPEPVIDRDWAAERAWQAARMRVGDPWLAASTGMRIIHGENDYMPGLVVDLYCDTAVVVFDGPAAADFWTPYIDAIAHGVARAGLQVARFWARPVRGQSGAGQVLRGAPPPAAIVIEEDGARFEVDVRAGQKTGFFLDQRQNRRLVRDLAAGAEVLNLFSYTGGFSVQAALGGARRVTSVDLSRPAIAAAQRNFAHNGLAVADHDFVAEDAFAYLDRAGARGAGADLVIVDPPSFAPSERAKPNALRAYTKLNQLAMAVVETGGWLLSASCSSHVTIRDMMAIIAQAGQQCQRRTRVVDVRGAASDHPVLPGFPEGDYLKVLLVRIE